MKHTILASMRPCPNCNSRKYDISKRNIATEIDGVFIRCEKCGVITVRVPIICGKMRKALQKAIDIWNNIHIPNEFRESNKPRDMQAMMFEFDDNLKVRCIVEIYIGCWLAAWEGDPGRTLKRESAEVFECYEYAEIALSKAREYRTLNDARIIPYEKEKK